MIQRVSFTGRRLLSLALLLVLLFAIFPSQAEPASASSNGLVISQVYGGGGNTGAVYTHDFVEIFNGGSSPISLGGLSVQYASATGTGNFGGTSTQLTELPSFILEPGQYYLVQQAAGAGNGNPLPTPDLIDPTPIAMAATAGKVVLVTGTTGLGCNGGSAPCSAEQLARIIDLVGFGSTANFFEGAGPTPTLSNSTAALRADNGCTDTDNNNLDFTAGTPMPRNSASPFNVCGVVGDQPPAVISVTPANGATDVPLDTAISLTFSEPVDVAGDWFSISCTASGAHGAAVSGGPATFTLTPDLAFAYSESCTVTIYAAQVSDQDSEDPPDQMDNDYAWSFSTVAPPDVCGNPFTPIYTIQGSGAVTPFLNQTVTTEGVVTGDFQGFPGLNGFFIQDAVGDSDAATSDGVFIFVPSASPFYNFNVEVGDHVRLTGRATEFQGLTEIDFITSLSICGQVEPLAPITLSLPEEFEGQLEQYEGMFISFENSFTVSQNFFQGRYGQVTLSSGDRLYNHTNQYLPGSPEAIALADENARRLLVLDDGNSAQNPNPIPYIFEDNTLRAGDLVENLVGLLDYGPINSNTSIRDYRLHPTASPNFTRVNERTLAPDPVGGNIKVASFNVLNYFTTIDQPGAQCFPTNTPNDCRGADSAEEFMRQRDKIVAALVAIDADVVGLMEIENNGPVAVGDLVNGLNDVMGAGTYAYITEPAPGGDAIKVAMIYKPAALTPFGSAQNYQVTTPTYGPLYDRPPLAQAFTHNLTNQVFSVIVNHFKSKGSCPASGPDVDQGDGQSCWNAKRTLQAQGLFGFIEQLASDTGDPDVVIIGDLNAYGKEDPIMVLVNGGLVDELRRFNPSPYTYVFDGLSGYLDHAISTPGLSALVTGATTWAINTDEPSVIDYNNEFKPQDLYTPTPYRSSDHDPVIVGLQLSYNFDGFFYPIRNQPYLNQVKAGSSVPIMFSLNGYFGLDILAEGYPKSQQLACGSSNPRTIQAPGSSRLEYDPETDTYTLVWKTEKSWANTCRQLILQLNDGSEYRADFSFTR